MILKKAVRLNGVAVFVVIERAGVVITAYSQTSNYRSVAVAAEQWTKSSF